MDGQHGGQARRRGVAPILAGVALVGSIVITAGSAAAQEPVTDPSTTTSTILAPAPPPDLDPAASGTTSSTAPATTTTTTTPPLAGEAGAENGGIGQGLFDPGSRQVLLAELAAARRRLGRIESAARQELRRLAPLRSELDGLRASDAGLDASTTDNAVDVATTREALRQQVVAAYVRSDRRLALLAAWSDAESVSRGETFLAALRRGRRDTLDELAHRSADLSTVGAELVHRLSPLETAVADSERRLDVLDLAATQGRAEVAAYLAGSHVFVPGFRFPVLGPVSFIDSWGFPRMPGTPFAHWHQGVDVMAPRGRELVAVEDGVMGAVGVAGLGGQRVWLVGRSGTTYYYAHLSAFGPGIAPGTPVSAGQVVGYVGDTGNAAGGAPHLHFEIHPGGGPAVNPYPLLATARGDEPMPGEAEVLSGPGALLPPGTSFAPPVG